MKGIIMENFKKALQETLRGTLFLTGIFAYLLGAAALYLAMPFLLVLTILKIVGAMSTTTWFGYPAVLSIIGTPFWMVIIGILIMFWSIVLMSAIEGK